MLRIAMISYHTCPLATLGGKDTGGMNVYVRELTRQLGKMGIHVDVFTRSQDDHVPHVLTTTGIVVSSYPSRRCACDDTSLRTCLEVKAKRAGYCVENR
jgi:hypothetical protein